MASILDGDLDAYSRIAVPMILARFPDWEPFATLQPRLEEAEGAVDFNIPCPSSSVEHGLWVSTVGEELTIGFHTHHGHFTDYGERTHKVQIEAGIQYAADILAERVGVLSYYRGGGFVGSRSLDLPHDGTLPGLLGDTGLAGRLIAGFLPDYTRITLRSWHGRFDRDDVRA